MAECALWWCHTTFLVPKLWKICGNFKNCMVPQISKSFSWETFFLLFISARTWESGLHTNFFCMSVLSIMPLSLNQFLQYMGSHNKNSYVHHTVYTILNSNYLLVMVTGYFLSSSIWHKNATLAIHWSPSIENVCRASILQYNSLPDRPVSALIVWPIFDH